MAFMPSTIQVCTGLLFLAWPGLAYPCTGPVQAVELQKN